MAILEALQRVVALDPLALALAVPACVLAVHLVPWLLDPHGLRNVPGPWLAQFSDAWLAWVAAHGHRSEVVHRLHQRYGPIVRIAPNHVSIADPNALQVVYAHGNGALKADFYDAFVSIRRGLFNTRDRAEHTRKRKIVSNVFSPKSVREFEPHIRQYIAQLAAQWDRLSAAGAKGLAGDEGEGGWRGGQGRVWLDCLPWFNYLAFDIIGDLAFGRPFGMLLAARDSAPVALSTEDAIKSYGSAGGDAGRVVSIPAVKILNDRGEFSASLGTVPPRWRALVKAYVPWFRRGNQAVKHLAGIAVMAVKTRLEADAAAGEDSKLEDADRTDLLSKLQRGKDDEGKPMGPEELTAEALTQLIAGSDTTSNSSCAITYYLASHPAVQQKLQRELDDALGAPDAGSEDAATSYDAVKHLPYLDAVINESLRLHSTSALGLARVVPAGAPLAASGRAWAPGTVLSVPSFSIHRDAEVWGEDADAFRPERWFEEERKEGIQKTFNPFSFGPRACVGRNLATMELFLIISSVFRRYNIVLQNPEEKLQTAEGFLRKPLGCQVGIQRRHF